MLWDEIAVLAQRADLPSALGGPEAALLQLGPLDPANGEGVAERERAVLQALLKDMLGGRAARGSAAAGGKGGKGGAGAGGGSRSTPLPPVTFASPLALRRAGEAARALRAASQTCSLAAFADAADGLGEAAVATLAACPPGDARPGAARLRQRAWALAAACLDRSARAPKASPARGAASRLAPRLVHRALADGGSPKASGESVEAVARARLPSPTLDPGCWRALAAAAAAAPASLRPVQKRLVAAVEGVALRGYEYCRQTDAATGGEGGEGANGGHGPGVSLSSSSPPAPLASLVALAPRDHALALGLFALLPRIEGTSESWSAFAARALRAHCDACDAALLGEIGRAHV